MFLGGWAFSLLVLECFLLAGVWTGSIFQYLPAITVISLAGTLVESLPVRDLDNLTVPFTAVLLGHFLL
jgi:dolichol kinase